MTEKLPNYVKKILDNYYADLGTARGTFVIARVYHDDWCDYFKGKTCNCKPDIVKEPAPKKTISTSDRER